MRSGKKRQAGGLTALAAFGGVLAAASVAHAGVEAWRVNEVATDPRFVELYAPPSADADNCFFPTTHLELIDGAGVLTHVLVPFTSTRCFPGDTYFVFAASGGDSPLPYPLDPASGQVCLSSSGTRYDCVRWGAVSVPVKDQAAPSDGSVAPAIGAGQALARVADTGVVASDFVVQAPTRRGPNDGGVWTPPDAAPPLPDAAPAPDAPPAADAAPDARLPPADLPDARTAPPAFLDAEPGGGGCACAIGAARAPRPAWLLAALGALGLVAQRRHQRRRGHRA